MDHNHNLLNNIEKPQQRRKKSIFKKIRKIFVSLLILLVVLYAFFYFKQLFFGSNEEGGTSWIDRIPLIGQVKHLAESSDRPLKGEERDRINILLLGIGGAGHDGGLLTDTIMVASLKPSTNQVSMLSIPRDLVVRVEGSSDYRKINSVHSLAEQRDKGSGGLAVSQTVSRLLDEPIDYYVRIDFDGFEKIIDQIGGVSVYVENTLDDYSYPIRGREDNPDYYSRFEHLHIPQGWQEMDGSLALKYARSRHGLRGEGSDFARARRQQNIMVAAKEKIFSAETLLNPKQITALVGHVENHLSTNLKLWEMTKLWNISKKIDRENITQKVLDNSRAGLLEDARGLNGAYILTPRSGDYSEIQYLFKNIFGETSIEANISMPKDKIKLTIFNGTWVNGLGSRTALDLEQKNSPITVVEVGNSSRKNFERSVIYDLTYGAKREHLEYLKEKTGANIAPTLPEWLKNDLADSGSPANQPDFILILGTDADKTGSGTDNRN